MSISLIIPTYNEKENIEKLIKKIMELKKDIKIYIIDDSINDEISLIASKFENVDYVYRGKKLGRGSAVIAGMKKTISQNSDIIIEMDADFSHHPEEIEKNLEKFIEEKLDLLISSRYMKKSKIINWSFKRKVFSRLSNILAKFFLKVPVSDYTNGYRIYSQRAIKHVIVSCGKIGDGFIVLSEILVQLHYNNFKINETSTIFKNRVRGESSVTLSEILKSLLGLFKIWKIKKKIDKNFITNNLL